MESKETRLRAMVYRGPYNRCAVLNGLSLGASRTLASGLIGSGRPARCVGRLRMHCYAPTLLVGSAWTGSMPSRASGMALASTQALGWDADQDAISSLGLRFSPLCQASK